MARRAAEWRDGSAVVHFGDGLAALPPGSTVLEALVALPRTSHCMGAPAVRFVQRENSIALRGEAGSVTRGAEQKRISRSWLWQQEEALHATSTGTMSICALIPLRLGEAQEKGEGAGFREVVWVKVK
jgi:hypothetical protein